MKYVLKGSLSVANKKKKNKQHCREVDLTSKTEKQ